MKKYRIATLTGALIVLYHIVVNRMMGDIATLSPEQWQTMEYLGWVRYMLLIVGIALTMAMFRKTERRDLSFKELFIVGLGSAAILAHFVGFMEFFYTLANPTMFDVYMKAQQQLMSQNGASAEQLQHMRQMAEQTRFMQTPLMNGIFYFVETLLLGTLTAAISALLMKKASTNPSQNPA